MKLLVFAHIPPPHHGQSYMVQRMLEGFGGDRRSAREPAGPEPPVACYHVNCRYSADLDDIGSFRLQKAWLVVRYSLEAIWCRFRYGVKAFYYIPAPGKRAALYRDWIVMLLCRPFFPQFIHHWHAVGLGDWLQKEGSWIERWLTHRLLARPALGIALAVPNLRDALWFRSRQVEVVANGIPDPCPDFEKRVLPRRKARLAARIKLLAGQSLEPAEREAAGGDPEVFHVLYLAHCTREKGVFDALEAVLLANERMAAQGSPLRLHLTIAGGFVSDAEKAELLGLLARPGTAGMAEHVGFAEGERKQALFEQSDAFCFPTYYAAEGQPVNLIEALAFGLPCVTTRWRAIPELLPGEFARFVEAQAPAQIAAALGELAGRREAHYLAKREWFLDRFVINSHVESLRRALLQAA